MTQKVGISFEIGEKVKVCDGPFASFIGLIDMGMNNLKSVRQGKHFEIEVDDTNLSSAEKKIDEMCKKLLVNLIIEDYKINKI